MAIHSLIIKHLKRSIISRPGGFQVIADVNAYTAFISTLHQADLTTYFSALKMVANVYILENPKDLVAFMRDVSRFEGTLRTEDAYEYVYIGIFSLSLQLAKENLIKIKIDFYKDVRIGNKSKNK